MSGLGQKAEVGPLNDMSGPLKADIKPNGRHVCFVPIAPPETDLFNHLVSKCHQGRRDFETKRFRRPRVDA
jgi:hypothetical protein